MKAELRVIAFLQVKQVNIFGLIAACGRKRRKWSTWARVFVPRRRPCKRHNLDFGTMMMCDGGGGAERPVSVSISISLAKLFFLRGLLLFDYRTWQLSRTAAATYMHFSESKSPR